jgi:DNA-binding IclR family transcriptional regulator
MSDQTDPYLVPGLMRGLAVLQAFTPLKPEMTLSGIAKELGITRSAAFRTVHTLVAEGYLLSTREGTHYRLGPAVVRLTYGYHASRELLEVAQPVLAKLRDDNDWSTHLGVLDGRHVLYLMRLPATGGLSSLVHVGSRLPAATTAMGRVLLAGKDTAFLRRLYTDLDPKALGAILGQAERDRSKGYVEGIGSFESGLSSVAAPVLDLSGEVVAAISATRVSDTIPPQVAQELQAGGDKISRGLGWRPAPS